MALQTYGDAARPMLETQRQQETNAWKLADGMLKPGQQQELRDLIQEWRKKYPNQRYVGAVRFNEFVTALGKTPTQSTSSPNSIFGLLFLDPFAGLDPTAAAIEETRRLGERAMYYTQRMPQLLSWQTEVLAYQLADQPESEQVLSNANQVATSAQSFAATARQLPQLINDQRQAAIQQLLDGLTSQETQARQTLNAAGDAATNINAAIQSLTEFVRYVSPTNASPASAATNSRPFNVLDYGTGRQPDRRRRPATRCAAHHGEPDHATTRPIKPANHRQRKPRGGSRLPAGTGFDSGVAGRLGGWQA